jgi:hypothetical protein
MSGTLRSVSLSSTRGYARSRTRRSSVAPGRSSVAPPPLRGSCELELCASARPPSRLCRAPVCHPHTRPDHSAVGVTPPASGAASNVITPCNGFVESLGITSASVPDRKALAWLRGVVATTPQRSQSPSRLVHSRLHRAPSIVITDSPRTARALDLQVSLAFSTNSSASKYHPGT